MAVSLRRWVSAAARAYDRIRPPAPGVVVLIYHRVGGGTASAVDMPVDEFDAQMEVLAAGTTVLTLDEAVTALAAGQQREGVVITFDDGTADFTANAVPVLQRHNLPAALYAATGFIDRQLPMPWGAPSATWDRLRIAVASGLITIGSHTRDHLLLDHATSDEIAEQLDASIDSITREIGAPPQHFAYPKAVRGNTAADVAVRERFASAALAGNRANRPGDDLYRLARTPVHSGDTPELFAAKVAGGLRLEGILRDMVTRGRALVRQR